MWFQIIHVRPEVEQYRRKHISMERANLEYLKITRVVFSSTGLHFACSRSLCFSRHLPGAGKIQDTASSEGVMCTFVICSPPSQTPYSETTQNNQITAAKPFKPNSVHSKPRRINSLRHPCPLRQLCHTPHQPANSFSLPTALVHTPPSPLRPAARKKG